MTIFKCRNIRPMNWLLFCAILLFCFGCGNNEKRLFRESTGQTPSGSNITKSRLRYKLSRFDEFVIASQSELMAELNRNLESPQARRAALQMQTRVSSAFGTMRGQDPPMIAFLDAWALSVRLKNYLESGEGSALFEELQPTVVNFAKKIENEIHSIGAEFLNDELFDQTQQQVSDFARKYPIKGFFGNMIEYATVIEKGKPGPFQRVIEMPMVPIKAFEGVDRTADAVYDFSGTASKIGDVLEQLPESTRWQATMLLYDLEQTQMVKSLLKSMDTLAANSAAIENLPAQIRVETEALVTKIDQSQSNLQATIEKAQALSESIDISAQSWAQAALATEQMALTFKGKDNDSNHEFDINDYRMTAESVTIAADKITNLTADVQNLLESQQAKDSIFATIRSSSDEAAKLINKIFWRLALLALFIFALAVTYRLIFKRTK